MKKWDQNEKDGISTEWNDFLTSLEKEINLVRPIDKLKADSVQL